MDIDKIKNFIDFVFKCVFTLAFTGSTIAALFMKLISSQDFIVILSILTGSVSGYGMVKKYLESKNGNGKPKPVTGQGGTTP